MDNYKSLEFLEDSYKNIIDIYFKNKPGKFIINDNVLEVDFDNWGKEYFYINNIKKVKETEIQKKIQIKTQTETQTQTQTETQTKTQTQTQIYYTIKYNGITSINSIALFVQIGNWDVFKKMESHINNFKNISINIYFFMIKDFDIDDNINYLKHAYNDCVIASCENKGMDIGPFLLNLHYIKTRQYNHEYIFKIHTKSSDQFRNESLNLLMKSHDNILLNIQKLSNKNYGILAGNIIYKYNNYREAFHSNLYHIKNIIKYLYNEDIIYDKLEFVGGTMFIAKLEIFKILSPFKILEIYDELNTADTLDYYWYSVFYKIDVNDKKRIYHDFNNNKINRYPNNLNYSIKTKTAGLRDSMIEHAFERVIGYFCKKMDLELIS